MAEKIIFTGGGTLGSVSPLLALSQDMQASGMECEFLWVGTKHGPEAFFIREYNIPYRSIPSGKFRRYFSLQNFFDPLFVFFGFIFSFFLLLRRRPSLIISAGGYVGVPLIWAGWLLRVPALVHQQDALPGLANKLTAPFAAKITVTFERSLKYFGSKKSVITGNPVRHDLIFRDEDRGRAYEFFGFSKLFPVVLILGGGTGASALNEIILQSLEKLLSFCQVIHSAGRGKMNIIATHSRYRSFEFLDRETLKLAYAAADLVVSRAGMSTLTELAFLKKPAIFIPIPSSHQEENINEFTRYNACMVLHQHELTAENFSQAIREVLFDHPLLHALSRNIGKVLLPDANARMLSEIVKILKR